MTPTPTNTRPPRHRSMLALRLLATACIASAASAQTDTPANVIELTPFEVNTERDVGYTATSALAGGRTDTALKHTPSAISVLTREFLDDMAMTGMREMAEWTVNASPRHDGGQPYELNIRGLGSSFPSRNYFVWYVNSDSFATERLEFARGPNGVLFGDGGVGGLVTTYSKRPNIFRDKYTLNLRTDSEGGLRASVDLNQRIGDRAAVRLNLLKDEGRGWRDRDETPRDGVQFSAAYRVTDRTTVRAEAEWGLYKRPIAPAYLVDQASFWTDPRNVYAGPGTPQPPTGNATGVARMQTNTYIPAMPELGFASWASFSRSSGTGQAIFPNAPRADIPNAPRPFPGEFVMNAADMVNEYEYDTYTLYLDHRFTDNLYFQLAYNRLNNEHRDLNNSSNYNTYYLDLNQVLPNGQPNPKFLVPYDEKTPTTMTQGNGVDDLRLLGTYHFNPGWINQRFSLIAGRRTDRFDLTNKTLYRVNNPANANFRAQANAVRVRLYMDEPGAYNTAGINVPGWELDYRQSGGFAERKTLEYAQLASTTQFFNDRITLHAGVRRDHLDRTSQTVVDYVATADATPDNPVGTPIWGAPVIQPDGRAINTPGAVTEGNLWVTSINGGGVYFVRPWLGIYANYSETFAPPTSGANLLSGLPANFSRSEGQDYGVKIVTANNKLSGSINYYNTIERDRIGGSNLGITAIRRLWVLSDRADLGAMNYRDTQDLEGTGWEFDFTANPTRSLRLIFNYALPKTAAINLSPGLKAYYAEHLPTWEAQRQAYLNNPGDGNAGFAAEMAGHIQSIAGALQGLEPNTTTNQTIKYTGNVYATYTFRGDFLKNLAVGLGANVRGPAKIGNTRESAYEYLYSNSYYILSGHLGYTRKFGKVETRFQLNVSNILDDDDIIIVGYRDYTVPGQPTVRGPDRFRYLSPRKFTLSTTLSF